MSGEVKLEPVINRFDFVEEVAEKDIFNTKWNVVTLSFDVPIPEFERITFDSSYKVKSGLGDHWEYTSSNHVKIDSSINVYFINKTIFFVEHSLKKFSIGIRDTILVPMRQIQQNKEDHRVYEEKFAIIMDKLTQDPASMQAFLKNPKITLEQAGIPLVENLELSVENIEEKIRVEKHWWGIDFIMNEKLTQDITNGEVLVEALGVLIGAAMVVGLVGTAGGATAVAGVVGGVLAAVIMIKYLEINIADNGNGVHWPITWIQWAIIIEPPIPIVMFPKAVAVIHPLRN